MSQYCQIVINDTFGSFGLSEQALKRYYEITGMHYTNSEIHRRDPVLINIIMTLGEKSFGKYAHLKIVNVLAEFIDYVYINECDGLEKLYFDGQKYMSIIVKKILFSKNTENTKSKLLISLVTSKLSAIGKIEYNDNLKSYIE